MNRAAFIDFSNTFFDKHSIYCLTSYLKSKGIDVEYIKENTFQKAITRIKALKPTVLLYSAFSKDVNDFIKFDKLVKQKIDVKSIMGGPGPTYDWSISERSTIDALCIGEGEYALDKWIHGDFAGCKNIVFRGEKKINGYFPFVDLDSLPFPERNKVYDADTTVRSMSSRQFLSGRGCPYSCTYCYNNAFNKMFKSCGKIIRKKSVDYLINEIRIVNEKYPFKTINFQDDTFIANKKWWFEFCELFPAEIGLPYTCNIMSKMVDEQVVRALKKSGCVGVFWSIESGNEFFRNTLLKRNMSEERILKTGRLLNKYKIPQRIGNIIGLPGEKFENMIETLKINIEVKPTLALAFIFIPYPALELTNYALENNFLSKDAMNKLPANYTKQSILNFTAFEKVRIQKFSFLFPILTQYPFFFHNKALQKFLLALPTVLIRILYELFYVYKMARVYNVKLSIKGIFLIIFRYLKDI